MVRKPKRKKPSARLSKLLQDSGLTLTEVAKRTGIQKSELSMFCAGKRDIGPHRAKRLADYFGLKDWQELWTNMPK